MSRNKRGRPAITDEERQRRLMENRCDRCRNSRDQCRRCKFGVPTIAPTRQFHSNQSFSRRSSSGLDAFPRQNAQHDKKADAAKATKRNKHAAQERANAAKRAATAKRQRTGNTSPKLDRPNQLLSKMNAKDVPKNIPTNKTIYTKDTRSGRNQRDVLNASVAAVGKSMLQRSPNRKELKNIHSLLSPSPTTTTTTTTTTTNNNNTNTKTTKTTKTTNTTNTTNSPSTPLFRQDSLCRVP